MLCKNLVMILCVAAFSVVQALDTDESQCFLPLREHLANNITESRMKLAIMETALDSQITLKTHDGVARTTEVLNKVSDYVRSKLLYNFRAFKCIGITKNLKPLRRKYREQVRDCINITSTSRLEHLYTNLTLLDDLERRLDDVLTKLCEPTDRLCGYIGVFGDLLTQLRCLGTETIPELVIDVESLLINKLDACITSAVDGVTVAADNMISDLEYCVNPPVKPGIYYKATDIIKKVIGG